MPERYIEAITKYLSSRDYKPLKPRQLARQMGVTDQEYDTFRDALKMLRDNGRVMLGAKNALTLPEITNRIVGVYRANPRGFGFIIPETPNAHGDLYVPGNLAGGAMTGDTVVAKVFKRGMRAGERMYHGQIVEILRRGSSRVVGTLRLTEGTWFVLPDGKGAVAPIIIADVGPGALVGQKVVAEITQYPEHGELARGVLVENLGAAGAIAVETQAIIRAHGLPDRFSDEALEEARATAARFNPDQLDGREDLTGLTIVTIDPPDSRDFDDAISLQRTDGGWVLGIHIADVSHFVQPGGALDREARERGNSAYFPRTVVPMLPELLSNGVCSLQEGQRRFCKSAFIEYDREANVLGTRLAETVIQSRKRLHYREAQAVIDGQSGGYAREVVELLRDMNELARLIESRRRKTGMLHLDLPGVELILDEHGCVVGAEPEDNSYTHTIIEMLMVEANEAVASALDRRNVPFLRRIHPDPDASGGTRLTVFARVCGHKLPKDLSRHDIQSLLAAVKGKPEAYAVNLAVLKSLEQATYSPMHVGHFALASTNYCHFTSPIRRYPDLTVHRLFADVARKGPIRQDSPADLVKLGEHFSMTERRAEAAEGELRTVLLLQLLSQHLGDMFEGVVTGVTNFGLFVQLSRYLIEGLIRMEDLGDDWWEVQAAHGEVRGERSGKRFRIGDPMTVRVVSVNIAGRQLNLAPATDRKPRPQRKPQPEKRKNRRKKK